MRPCCNIATVWYKPTYQHGKTIMIQADYHGKTAWASGVRR